MTRKSVIEMFLVKGYFGLWRKNREQILDEFDYTKDITLVSLQD